MENTYIEFNDLQKNEQDSIYNYLKSIYSEALLEDVFNNKHVPPAESYSYYFRGVRLG